MGRGEGGAYKRKFTVAGYSVHRVSSSYFFLFFKAIPIFSYFLAGEAKICNRIENGVIVVCVKFIIKQVEC